MYIKGFKQLSTLILNYFIEALQNHYNLSFLCHLQSLGVLQEHFVNHLQKYVHLGESIWHRGLCRFQGQLFWTSIYICVDVPERQQIGDRASWVAATDMGDPDGVAGSCFRWAWVLCMFREWTTGWNTFPSYFSMSVFVSLCLFSP